MGKFHESINEVQPTAKQERAAMKKARDDAYACLETALASLDDARRHFTWMGDDIRLSDCQTAIAMAEDLKDSMEVEHD